jgi:hypothetical protein
MSEKLLPCPFCGSGNVVRGGDDKMVAVFCGTCGACGPDEYGSSNEWNRRTPAPKGEVMAWFRQSRANPDDWYQVKQDEVSDFRRLGNIVQPLYASPVVPVGVSRKRVRLIVSSLINDFTHFPFVEREAFIDRKTDAIIAALRPTDTGWREITAEARNGDDVLAYDDETGDCHVSHWTGDYWYGPNGFKPTHWMPLPKAPGAES